MCAYKTLICCSTYFLNLFLERGGGGEREREREKYQLAVFHTRQPGAKPATQTCALIGNQTGDLLLCKMMPNPLSLISQGCSTHLCIHWLILVSALMGDQVLIFIFKDLWKDTKESGNIICLWKGELGLG